MSKVDSSIINSIRMLSLDMIKSAGSGDSRTALNSSSVFYSLFMYHLIYDPKKPDWMNRDRLIIGNKYLPIMYASLHTFGYDISLDNLKDYKKLNSSTPGFGYTKLIGIDNSNMVAGDIIGTATGIALGERYLEKIIKDINPKNNLINYKTYCVCSISDIKSGAGLETLNYLAKEKLNKLIIIAINDGKKDNLLINNLRSLNFNVSEVDSSRFIELDELIDEAKISKKNEIIIANMPTNNPEGVVCIQNMPLTNDDMNKLRTKYEIPEEFYLSDKVRNEIQKNLSKRLDKEIKKWENFKEITIQDSKLKEIFHFLKDGNVELNLNIDNLKINENYEEELEKGNNKIFNIVAKNPFVFNLYSSEWNSIFINKSSVMSKDEVLGRNIVIDGVEALASIASGLAYSHFKVFVSMPLIFSTIINSYIKCAVINNLSINYIFTHDNFLDTYHDNGIGSTTELSFLRMTHNLLVIRPADINEIIGTYNIIANYNNPVAMILNNTKLPKLTGTNPKYVLAGAYRIKRENEAANGVIIATGSEVNIALKVAEELLPYGIDLRVVSAPSVELFERQSDRYKFMLLPRELKTFVIEFADSNYWYKYATDNECVFGINQYTTNGTKEELLNLYNLNLDSIKAKIIEKYRNN